MTYNSSEFRYKKAPTLFLCLTNKCNLNCNHCYIHHKTTDNEVAELGDMIDAIDSTAPGKLVITGGEPLLYPREIVSLMNYYKADYKQHWNVTLCTNLLYDEIDELQLEAIRLCDYLQTTYSIDRFTDEQYKKFVNNFNKVKENTKLKAYDTIVTITEKQLEEDPKSMIDKLLNDLDPDGLAFEQLSYPTITKDKDIEEFYNKTDEYMLEVFKCLLPEKNLTLQSWKKSIENNMTVHCTVCDDGYSKVFNVDQDSISNGCICLINKESNRKEKFKKYCINCDLFKYCRMDCERFGNYCAFPKNTFRYALRMD